MNSRVRTMAALNHTEPDRVPIDLGGNNTGIHIIAYRRLIEHLGIEDKNILYRGFKGQSALPCEELLQRFDVDIRYLRPTPDSLPVSAGT